ncbi:hypothetical protein INN71_04910 [Nocardioides sp. ChNu-153]|uniref:hypothetical protein n=1 Tax=unclassified Nocardioides TaxID=2615069 RepID=UPI0024077517|nr:MULTISPECIES: hypothetical protein [unclassified Nocardioides]MDF9715516.1 hypothetical protein [Nocardioides sp. ChNu-99]MDN7120729.1 hypothetical protein [Nocardioides sp. ChNu-153]
MESNELRTSLRDLERAEAAPYVDFPPTPWWYFLAVPAWAAAMTTAVHLALVEDVSSWWLTLALVALALLVGAFVGWYGRYHGAVPSLRGSKPREIRTAYRQYAMGAVLVLLAIGVAVATLPWWGSAAVAFVAVGAGIGIYEVAYSRAAAAARERLA